MADILNSQKVHFSVPARHPSFADHFPFSPVVAGALLLQWVSDAVISSYSNFDKPVQVVGISSFRFHVPVLPQDELELHLQMTEQNCSVHVVRNSSAQRDILVAKGKLLLGK